MPTIAARCPKCQTVFKLKDPSLAGKKIKCRKCQTPFRVQAPARRAVDADEYGHTSDSATDPYGRNVAFAKPGVLPVGGRKINKISKTQKKSAEEVEAEEKKKAEEWTKLKRKMLGIGGAVVTLVLVIGGIFFGPSIVNSIANAGKIEPPKNYVEYAPDDSALKFEYPEGWEVEHGGGTGGQPIFASIVYGGVSIRIKENLGASAMGEAAQALGQGQAQDVNATELAPVHGAHIQRQQTLMETVDGYEEFGTEVFESGLGDSRLSEFKEQGMLTTVVGYRATLMKGRHTYFVTCSCRQGQFESLKPVFRRVLESISQGRRP